MLQKFSISISFELSIHQQILPGGRKLFNIINNNNNNNNNNNVFTEHQTSKLGWFLKIRCYTEDWINGCWKVSFAII